MPAPVGKLRKREILWLANHHCKSHRHSYLEHWNCYLKEVVRNPDFVPARGEDIPMLQKIGYLDIESSNFQASFGIVICYCILDSETGKILERCVTSEEVRNPKILDKNVMINLSNDIKKFDRICTFYGSKFDIPFLRTRAVFWNIDFPTFQDIYHTDVYYIIRNKFRLHSNRQQVAYNILVGTSNKTHFGRDYWIRALAGDKKALKYILEHCRIDVKELSELHAKVDPFVGHRNTSI